MNLVALTSQDAASKAEKRGKAKEKNPGLKNRVAKCIGHAANERGQH